MVHWETGVEVGTVAIVVIHTEGCGSPSSPSTLVMVAVLVINAGKLTILSAGVDVVNGDDTAEGLE